MNEPINIDNQLFSLIPGPEKIEYTTDSQCINDILEYDVDAILFCLLNYEGIEIIQNSTDVYERKLVWKKEERNIEISFSSLDGTNSSPWGGSDLKGICYYTDIMNLWNHVKCQFRAVWLHDKDCIIYSVEAFEDEFIKLKTRK